MKQILTPVILIFIIILSGTLGYMIIEKWRLFDALYMTIITISTVGFHEVAYLGIKGRIFTLFLIILGIGVGGYTIGKLSAFLIEGKIQHLFKGKKMEKKISSLKDHIIVCGLGRTGSEIISILNIIHPNFVIVDRDDDKVLEAQQKDYLVLQGDATDDDILKKAGVHNAFGLISALGNDAENVYVVLTARGLNSKLRIIARGIDETSSKKLIRAGADKVVSPFSIAGRRMAYLTTHPEVVEFLEIMNRSAELELKLEQVLIHKKSYLVNKKLNESNIKSETDGAMVVGIKKNQSNKMIVNPPGEMVLEEDDILVALGNNSQIEKLTELSQKKGLIDIN
ncbi:potassium channel protein [candidate division KSB1 bacterium]|nr:potassium channel protein [candidate division KSB1 bacterium]